jgi:hypothetical protein
MKTKKNLFLTFIALGVISCSGPSASDIAKKKPEDSIKVSDSLKRVQFLADSILATNSALANDLSTKTNTPADKKLIKTAEMKFQVKNVWRATEKIEDLLNKYDGYMTYSNLQNRNGNYSSSNISMDSVLTTREIIVENEIKLRVPNIKLDSFIRELTPLVSFLDYRVIKMDDVTLQSASIDKKGERFKTYENRQTKHIDTKGTKLKETANAEDNLLDKQLQADEIALKAKELADQLKYCDITIEIYQKPLIYKEIKADFKYISSAGPGFFARLWDSLAQGFGILEEILLFLVKIWGIIFIGLAVWLGIKILQRKFGKK